MMMRHIPATAALVALLLASTPGLAQSETPDTTSAWRYFPLEVGNEWEYRSAYDGLEHLERRTVASDTLIDGARFFRYDRQPVSIHGVPLGLRTSAYVRFDTLSTAIRWWDGADPPPFDILADCPLGVPFESTQTCPAAYSEACITTVSGGHGRTIQIGNDVAETTVKWLDTQGCEIISSFGAGLGFVRFLTLGAVTELLYARVGGVTYGQPLAVDAEGTPSPGPHLAVTAAPNPARHSLTVTLSRAEAGQVRVEVFDVQGRSVALLHDGPLPAGTHPLAWDASPLPAGTYVVRASGQDFASLPVTIAR